MIHLNPEQEQAARFKNGVASVIAVPGSGKTLTMTHRIGNLVNSGVNPESILGLTFTRNAAAAMKKTLKNVLKEKASRVTLQTIHAFCNGLLRTEGRTFEILPEKDQLIMIKQIMKKAKINQIPSGSVLREIHLAKNHLIAPDDFKECYAGDFVMMQIWQVYWEYEHAKKKKLLLDLDDLLVETHRILKDQDEIRQRYQKLYAHVLVDEFQDTNPSQMEILKLLVGNSNGNGRSFWICGDDWQSIFAFTGASVGNIINFNQVFPNCQQFILHVNYRSTPQILQVCQRLIEHNVRRIEKTLTTGNPDGEGVVVLAATNEEDEANQLVMEIKELIGTRGYEYKDIAILYRSNFQSRVFEEGFSKNKVPYHIENGTSFYQRREVKILLDYLRFIDNPVSEEGDEALRQIINVPNRYIGRAFMEELAGYAGLKNLHLYQALKTMRIDIPYVRRYVREFIAIMEPLIKDAKQIEPVEMIGVLRAVLDYDRFITDDDIPSPDDEKIANINQLQLSANRYSEIKLLLNYTETFQDEISNDKNGVSLMTVHKAKGLEFPVVCLTGMIEGLMPHQCGDIEEERRIAFVGASRAMKLLYLSYSFNYMGRTVKKSSFVDEMMGKNAQARENI